MHYCSRYHLSNIVLENVVLTLDKLIMGAYRLHFFKKPRWPTLPHLVGQCGPPPFFKKGAPRGPSQNFFPGRLIAMQKCHIASIVKNFKFKVYEKNLKKCSQMAHITPRDDNRSRREQRHTHETRVKENGASSSE